MAVQVFNLGQRVSLPPCTIAILLTIEKLSVCGLEPLAFSSSRLSPRSMNTRGVIHRGQSILNVPTVIPADDAILERILETTYPTSHQGLLSRSAFTKLDAAQRKTIWGLGHQRRFALVEKDEVLASAQRYALNGALDRQRVSICGIGAVCTDPSHGNEGHAEVLVERLIDEAKRDGADMAIVFVSTDPTASVSDGFQVIPTTDVELTVAESPRRGAPMTMVRGGEDRDLAAIVAMGEARASPFRFHLERDVDFVKYTMTRKRLLAGLGSAGVRQFQFVIAEEGITAAAYVVISSVGGLVDDRRMRRSRCLRGARGGHPPGVDRPGTCRAPSCHPRIDASRLRSSPGHDRLDEAHCGGDFGAPPFAECRAAAPVERAGTLLEKRHLLTRNGGIRARRENEHTTHRPPCPSPARIL